MSYVDGFVIPLQKKDIPQYKKMAAWGKRLWKKYGALDYYECIGDDLRVKKGMGMGFTKLAKLKRGETVIFSFIVYKSRAHRDEVNKKVMSSPEMRKADMSGAAIDMKRFSVGGFKVLVQM